MTCQPQSNYCLCLMEAWQYKAAFVVQFGPATDIEAERFEGRVEHVSSMRAQRFHSLDELLVFIAAMLKTVRNADQP